MFSRLATINSKAKFGKVHHMLLLALVWFVSRLPVLGLGYGTDADAWRVAYQGWQMSNLGGYIWSRPPGYPLFEILISKLVNYGWFVTNGVVAIAGLGCALLLWNILVEQAGASPVLATAATIAFGFVPAVWIASTMTMDYVFAELFLLASWYLFGRSRLNLSAISLGISVGFRPNMAVFLVPMLAALFITQRSESIFNLGARILAYFVQFVLASTIAYSPVLFTYGLNVFPQLASRPPITAMGYHLLEIFGVIGWVGLVSLLILLLIVSLPQIKSHSFKPKDSNVVLLAVLGVLINLAVFAYFPDESLYLLPAIPWLFFLLVRLAVASPRSNSNMVLLFTIMALLFLTNSFLDVRLWQRDAHGKTQIAMPSLGSGFVLADVNTRISLVTEAQSLFKSNTFQRPCIALTGWHYPIVRVYQTMLLPQTPPDCEISQLLTKTELSNALQRNVTVYYVSGVETLTNEYYGYSLSDYSQLVYLDFGNGK